jgi:hypothetical protein
LRKWFRVTPIAGALRPSTVGHDPGKQAEATTFGIFEGVAADKRLRIFPLETTPPR